MKIVMKFYYMGKPLSTYAVGRDNNFSLIRFVASLLVIYCHSFALATGSGNAEPLAKIMGITIGSVAVDIFLVHPVNA